MNFKETWNAARLRAGAMIRERKEKAAERKALKQAAAASDQHAHSRFWLLNVPAIATICAAIVEWYWAMLFCIEATGQFGFDWSTQVGSDAAPVGAWHFIFDIQNIAVLLGLVLATIPIVMLSMVWLPVQFAMRGAGAYRRGSIIAVGVLANILVIVSGTVVMNYNRQDQVREAVVTEQTAQQGRAAIDARLGFEQEQLRLALSNTNPYLNQAANVGAAEWERSYVAQARATNDPRLPQLERALGAARAADERRANIERLTIERATAAPEAATASNVEDTVGSELNTFAQYVEVWRPPFVAFICTLIGIFGAWWTLAMLERLNPIDVLRSGWAREDQRIEDLREEERPQAEPMMPPKRRYTDAETGEEIEETYVKAHRRERKLKPKKGEAFKVDIQPPIMEDERGVNQDGGNRTATTIAGPLNLDDPLAMPERFEQNVGEAPQDGDDRNDHENRETSGVRGAEPEKATDSTDSRRGEHSSANVHDEETLPVFEDETNTETQDPEPVESVQENNAEPDQEREPETREDRLLPSSVAAE